MSGAARFAHFAVILLALLYLTSALADPTTQKTRIEVPVFAGGEGMDFFIDSARDYEKIHPEVIVDLYGDSRIDDKVRIRVLEGTWFEITNATGLDWWGLIHRGEVEPLDDVLDGPSWERDRTWRDSFVPGSLNVFQ